MSWKYFLAAAFVVGAALLPFAPFWDVVGGLALATGAQFLLRRRSAARSRN